MSDKSIRYQWLGLLIWTISISIFQSTLTLLNEPNIPVPYMFIAFPVAASLGFSYLMYHCIYKKPGTKLLTFCLILSAVSLLITLFLFFSGKFQAPPYFSYFGVYTLVTQLVGIWGFVISWKMLKINRRLKLTSK